MVKNKNPDRLKIITEDVIPTNRIAMIPTVQTNTLGFFDALRHAMTTVIT
jgi:hypothetical protein